MMSKNNILLVFIALCLLSLVAATGNAREPLDPAKIERLRVIGASNTPLKIMVFYHPTMNQKMVAELINVVAEINRSPNLPDEEKVKVYMLNLTKKPQKELQDLVSKKDFRDNVEIHEELFMGSDVWLQDWGEVAMVKLRDDPKAQLLIFDSNRGQGLAELPGLLAKFWNAYYIKNPAKKLSGGDSGGNIEVTPDDILVIGNTMNKELQNFFGKYGYKNKTALVETDWLVVGHCDEHLSFIPDIRSPKGYSLVKANPRQAMDLLMKEEPADLQNIHDPEYAKILTAVARYLKANGYPDPRRKQLEAKDQTYNGMPAKDVETFIRQNLAIASIIDSNANLVCQTVQKVTGSKPEELKTLSYPVLFHLYQSYKDKYVAFIPGAVNQLILREHLVIPDPMITVFREAIRGELKGTGTKYHFVNDLYYHERLGEVHCGTNVFRHPNRYYLRPRDLPADLEAAGK